MTGGNGCSLSHQGSPSAFTLDISGNRVDTKSASHLANALKNPLCALQTLQMVSCGLSRKALNALGLALFLLFAV